MGITGSVGNRGRNNHDDVVMVQVLLDYNRPVPFRAIDVDGVAGLQTAEAIREFQGRVMHMAAPDGRVDPGGATLNVLREGLPWLAPPPLAREEITLSSLLIKGIVPGARLSRIEIYQPYLTLSMNRRQINTPLRQAHFLAQLGQESDSFATAEEYASGEAYEGRSDLGNTQPGDGRRFKGRGLIQLTGRSNYAAYGTAVGMDLTNGNPVVVATNPSLAVDVSTWFWDTHNLNHLADSDNVDAVTRVINGGLNGITQRRAFLQRAKFLFGL